MRIIICNRNTQYAIKEQQSYLMEKAHSSALGGHKGVTKTFNRIRQHFYWQNMKLVIQKYIQTCLKCNLKKPVRIKSKEPLITTDTPGTAFDKVSMDIVN